MSDLPLNGGATRPQPLLQWGNPDIMFFDIVGHLWWNLEAESDQEHPKSIYFKARDILRVLPHWWEYVVGLSEGERPDLSVLQFDYHELMKQATETLVALTPLLDFARDARAKGEYIKLYTLVHSTYERRPTNPTPAGVQQTVPAAQPA